MIERRNFCWIFGVAAAAVVVVLVWGLNVTVSHQYKRRQQQQLPISTTSCCCCILRMTNVVNLRTVAIVAPGLELQSIICCHHHS